VHPWLRGSGVALEIGCGIGRLTLPVARRFDRVIAVDVAPTMLRRLSESCAARGVTNVEPALAGDAWHHRGVVDFAYSRIVFQHIADWDVIADYLRRIADCLADDGVLYAQFDTRPATALYRIKTALPDAVLPRTWRRGVRRIRRVAPRIVEVARTLALEPVLERGAGTFDTEFVFRRRPRHIASRAETPSSL
jgi:cyclopropane fatty-acyl-phospholipid synthase-like methyltransferase